MYPPAARRVCQSSYTGSENRFNRYSLDSRFYFPVIRERAGLPGVAGVQDPAAGRLRAQRLPHSGVPIFERYFPGGIFGAGEIRGFRLRSLGPKIRVQSSPDPTSRLFPYEIGGNLLTALNAELEFMMIPPANIKGVLFFDTGNAFNTESLYCEEPSPSQLPKADPCQPWRPRDLRYSLGFGFRWQSPIGPLRFEWGFPLDRQRGTDFDPRADDPVVFEFSIGNSF